MGVHGGTNLTTLTGAALTTEIQNIQAYFKSPTDGGPEFDWRYLVYPNGAFNDEVQSKCQAEGIICARMLQGVTNGISSWDFENHNGGIGDAMRLMGLPMSNTGTITDVATFRDRMDEAIRTRSTLITVSHALGATGLDQADAEAIFEAARDEYIDTGLVRHGTLKTWFEGLGGTNVPTTNNAITSSIIG